MAIVIKVLARQHVNLATPHVLQRQPEQRQLDRTIVVALTQTVHIQILTQTVRTTTPVHLVAHTAQVVDQAEVLAVAVELVEEEDNHSTIKCSITERY